MKTRYSFMLGVVAAALAVVAASAVRTDPAFGTTGASAVAETRVPLVFSSLRDGNAELYAVQPDGSGLRRLTNHRALDAFPSLSPDGTRVAFVSTRDGNSELYAMNLDGTGLVRLTNNRAVDAEPDWSPDGERIAFTSSRSGNGDIYSAGANDGSGLARLTSDRAIDASPAWSADGSQLAFFSSRSGNGDVYRIETDGSQPRRLTTSAAADLFPAWSPDGDRIAFASLRSGNSDIYAMHPDGTQQTRLTRSAAIESEPAWSPDGSRLAISANVPGRLNFDLQLLNADGSGAAALAPHPAFDSSPDWHYGETAPPPFDGDATPILDAPNAVSATIGRDGGSLESAGVRLQIPAGALSEPVLITLTPLAGLAGSPLDDSFLGGAKLEPEGLRFLKPALLSLPLPGGVDPVDVLGFGSAGDGSDLHLQPRAISAGTITLQLWHFSTGGASGGGAGAAAAMQAHPPSTAERQALQRIAAAMPACEAEQEQGIFGGPGCVQLLQEAVRALSDWYLSTVKPGLEQAVNAPFAEAVEALAEWLSWQHRAEQALADLDDQCGEVESLCEAARALATAAVAAHATRRLENCTGTSLVSELGDVGKMADFAEAGAIDLTSVGLPAAVGGALLRACAHLEIEVLDFPAVAALFNANTLRGRVSVDVYGGPNRTDVPFTLTADGNPVTTAADGSFETPLRPTAPGLNLNVELEAEATSPALQTTSFNGRTTLIRPTRHRIEVETLGPAQVGAGATVGVRVRVAGDGMSGAAVALTLAGPGSLDTSQLTTTDQGEATATYTAPTVSGSATVTAVLPDGAEDSFTITTTAPIQVSLSPEAATLNPGQQLQFTATVTNANDSTVAWAATGGAITQTGLYTAGTTPGTYAVAATSVEDPTKSATATVTIESAGIVSISRRSGGLSASADACEPLCNTPPTQVRAATPGEFSPFNASVSNSATAGGSTASSSASADVRVIRESARTTLSYQGNISTQADASTTPPDTSANAFASSNGGLTFTVVGAPVRYRLSGSLDHNGAADTPTSGEARARITQPGAFGAIITIQQIRAKAEARTFDMTGTLPPGSYSAGPGLSCGSADGFSTSRPPGDSGPVIGPCSATADVTFELFAPSTFP